MEVEIKLLLQADEAARLRQRLGAPLRVEHQTNHYYDDDARRLARAGWGLRVREIGVGDAAPRTVLTLKHAGDEAGEFQVRPEYETGLDPSEVEPDRVLRIARELLADPSVLPEVQLREIGRMQNRREVFALPGDGPQLELDRTRWPDGSVSEELEVEAPSVGDVDDVLRPLRVLFNELGIEWRVGRESKLQRLLRML